MCVCFLREWVCACILCRNVDNEQYNCVLVHCFHTTQQPLQHWQRNEISGPVNRFIFFIPLSTAGHTHSHKSVFKNRSKASVISGLGWESWEKLVRLFSCEMHSFSKLIITAPETMERLKQVSDGERRRRCFRSFELSNFV